MGRIMTTSREKINKIIDLMVENVNLKEVQMIVKTINIRDELNKKLDAIDDSKLDALIDDIKKIVTES